MLVGKHQKLNIDVNKINTEFLKNQLKGNITKQDRINYPTYSKLFNPSKLSELQLRVKSPSILTKFIKPSILGVCSSNLIHKSPFTVFISFKSEIELKYPDILIFSPIFLIDANPKLLNT